ncbi:MAG: hypothetical protein U1E76_16245 [Planctomycetota bacterium]
MRRRQAGAILVALIIVLAAMSTLLALLSGALARPEARLARDRDRLQAELNAECGLLLGLKARRLGEDIGLGNGLIRVERTGNHVTVVGSSGPAVAQLQTANALGYVSQSRDDARGLVAFTLRWFGIGAASVVALRIEGPLDQLFVEDVAVRGAGDADYRTLADFGDRVRPRFGDRVALDQAYALGFGAAAAWRIGVSSRATGSQQKHSVASIGLRLVLETTAGDAEVSIPVPR